MTSEPAPRVDWVDKGSFTSYTDATWRVHDFAEPIHGPALLVFGYRDAEGVDLVGVYDSHTGDLVKVVKCTLRETS